MYAVQFDRFGPPEVLSIGRTAEPHAGPREVRIVVRAVGVAPADAALRAGTSPLHSRIALPHIPGVDAAGVVDEVGAELEDVSVGAEVFGSLDIARLGGASAEFAVLKAWTAKPEAMPWEQAGAAATSVETATRALDRLGVGPGVTLLIDGAAGGVGSVAVQLAVARGASVIGTARPESHTFVSELGAVPVTYGPELPHRLSAFDGRLDAALDIAGHGSVPELIALTGSPTTVLTLADFSAAAHGVALSVGELRGEPSGNHGLADAARLFDDGRFHIPVQATFSIVEASRAHAAVVTGPRRGKIALSAGEEAWSSLDP